MKSKKVFQSIEAKAKKAIQAAGHYLVQQVQTNISSLYPPASQEGSAPHLRTGELQSSIYFKAEGDKVQVGSTAPYALDLEFGTSKMAPRPFLLSTTMEEEKNMAAIIKKEMKL